MRYGKPIIFEVDAFQMDKDGFKFKCSKNNVWLTEFVPAKYLKIIDV
jgi:putative RNA 2'-phosphotransferase